MIRNIIIILILCGSLAACKSSPRKHYFILSAESTAMQASSDTALQNTVQPQKSASEKSNLLIGIGPIEVADYLDRSYVGYAEDDNTLTIADNDYWAEPLEKGVARITAINLAQLSPNHSFISFPWRSDSKPQYSLRIQLHSLTRSNNQASISATWELIDNIHKSNLKRKNFTQSIAVAPGTKGLVQAYSKLFAALNEEMNQSLINLQ